jgi:uncharacterized protein YrzB (UPF0473 family)
LTKPSRCVKITLREKISGRAAERGNIMAENKNIENELEITEGESLFITLTDEETGEEFDFEVIGEAELDGNVYRAIMPVNSTAAEDGIVEYMLVKILDDDTLTTVDDDAEFDKVANYFDDLFDSEEDYDA